MRCSVLSRDNATPRDVRCGRCVWAERTGCSLGWDAGGGRAVAIYSLTETAKLNALDPEDYLRQVLQRIAEHPVKRVHELVP
jgi:hypothetical protein